MIFQVFEWQVMISIISNEKNRQIDEIIRDFKTDVDSHKKQQKKTYQKYERKLKNTFTTFMIVFFPIHWAI